MLIALMIVAAYLVGSIPTAVIVSKLTSGVDIRTRGSGNAGAANTVRVLGLRIGIVVGVVDVVKGLVAALVLPLIGSLPGSSGAVLCGLAATLGHVFPVFAGFRGGKGVATAAGAAIPLFPALAPICLAACVLAAVLDRRVVVASLTAASSLPVLYFATGLFGAAFDPWRAGFCVSILVIIAATHHANIGLLLRGKEKRFELPALFRGRSGESPDGGSARGIAEARGGAYSYVMKTNIRLLQVANLASFAAVLVVNALASTVGLNGHLTGALSDAIPNLFVPAGITFSVWGVIYLFLLLFSVGQARGLFARSTDAPHATRRIGWLFVLSCVGNIGWLLLWHWEQVGWSVLAMLVILGSLIAIHERLSVGRAPATLAERWLFRVPFSIYLGWITVATIANITAFLVTSGWNGFGLQPELWTVAVIVVAALLTAVMLASRRNVAYALVVLWALAGIALKRSSDGSAASRTVMIAAVACGAVVAAAIVASAVRSAARPLKA